MKQWVEVFIKNKNLMKNLFYVVLVLIVLGLVFRTFFGIFIIQPMGAIPEGVSIVYKRTGINLPFISSADGVLEKSGQGVSLLGRGIVIAKLSEPIIKNEVFRFSYSEKLYLISTNGKKYEKQINAP